MPVNRVMTAQRWYPHELEIVSHARAATGRSGSAIIRDAAVNEATVALGMAASQAGHWATGPATCSCGGERVPLVPGEAQPTACQTYLETINTT